MNTTDSQRIPSVSDEEPGLPTAGVQRIQIQELTFEKLIGEGVILIHACCLKKKYLYFSILHKYFNFQKQFSKTLVSVKNI